MIRVLRGTLQIDEERGVIYFHCESTKEMKARATVSPLRICNLPHPIPDNQQLDITHLIGQNWGNKEITNEGTV